MYSVQALNTAPDVAQTVSSGDVISTSVGDVRLTTEVQQGQAHGVVTDSPATYVPEFLRGTPGAKVVVNFH